MRVIMTGGGTGGHIYPAVAIADEIKRCDRDAEILFVGAEIGMEGTLVPKCGYDIELIPVEGFERGRILCNIDILQKYHKANKKSKKIIRDFKPDVVIGTGGYASAPVVKTAQKMGIPTYIHEQNAFPGISNKMQEKKAVRVFLGFAEGSAHFRYPEKHVVTGNPVRTDFIKADRQKTRQALGFKDNDFVLLAFGGSQGAGRINKAMIKVVEAFNGVGDIRICLGTGKHYYDAIIKELQESGVELKDNIKVMEYIDDMPKYLSAADLVVSRSGALTVAEVTVCGRPAAFIPSPNVSGNHQFFNARAVEEKGGAIIIEEKELDNDKLISIILGLKNDPQALHEMSEKSAACALPDAVKIIYDSVIDTYKK